MPTLKTRTQVAIFGFLLGCSGVPIYIHLPRFASTDLGIGLAIVGVILICIRVLDFVQDPFLGRIVDRFPRQIFGMTTLALFGLATGFLMVFSWPYESAPALWLTFGLIILLTSYSLATILLYGMARSFAGEGMLLVSVYRESGIVLGILFGSVTPSVLGKFFGMADRYEVFGYTIAGLSLLIIFLAAPVMTGVGAMIGTPEKFITTPKIRRLILIALVNALPVAITSTLFLFFVEDVLRQPTLGGPFLASFFLAAGSSVPLWNHLSRKFGTRDTLTFAMMLAVLGFVGAAFLTPQSANWFWLICITSGIAVGADMIILPILFTSVLIFEKQPAGQAFGLWFLASKLSLAGAAVFALPLLQLSGFEPGAENSTDAIWTLVLIYSVIPCFLKTISIVLIRTLPKEVYST